MTSKQINDKALDNLSKQDWMNAQRLLFQNAKMYPSYQTYNNLGYYLISEGLIGKNGKTRSAWKNGIKYLMKSSEIKATTTNLCAIVKAVDYQLRTSEETEKTRLYIYARDCLEKALFIEYSDELQYNFLRFSYMADPGSQSVLSGIRKLVKQFASEESVSLYLELLGVNSLTNEGLVCISNYGSFLDEVDLLIFYTRVGLFDEGYRLCETVYKQYSVNESIASFVIECCVHTQHLAEAQKYAEKIREKENDIHYRGKKEWCNKVFENLERSTIYRKGKIDRYRSYPPLIDSCCYFGCSLHKTDWEN